MADLRFDERVVVVTGAGRGLGRSYALLLASRGARIVVNDTGVSMAGDASNDRPAAVVVDEIRALGGEAFACTESVASPAGGAAIISAAMEHFGRIDALIHNAGIVRRGTLDELSYEDFEAVLEVHLRGGFHVLRPALRHMKKAGYGRIVMTGSISGLYGNTGVGNYSVAKNGLIGLSNVAAIEGAEYGVKSNVILPAAVTRMSEGVDTSAFPPMDPDLVAPAVAWLCHESCSVTGEMLISAAGRVARTFVAETRGVYRPGWSIENVAENIEAIRSRDQVVDFDVVPNGMGQHLGYSFGMGSSD